MRVDQPAARRRNNDRWLVAGGLADGLQPPATSHDIERAMRHRVAHRKLGRVTEHRIAMLRNQATALLRHEHLTTTVPRAKELRPFVERLITIAKRGVAGGDGERPAAERAPPGHAGPAGPRSRHASCSTRSRRASRRAPAATRACCGSATARATAPKSRRSSSSAASSIRARRPRKRRRLKARRRRQSAAACAPRLSGCAAARRQMKKRRLSRAKKSRPSEPRRRPRKKRRKTDDRLTTNPRCAVWPAGFCFCSRFQS